MAWNLCTGNALVIFGHMNKYIIIGSIIISVILIVTIVIFAITRDGVDAPQKPTPTPPRVLITPATQPIVDYQDSDQEKAIDYIKNRKELEEQDASVRAKFISDLNGQSGIVHSTSTYQIEYLRAPNAFMVAVQSTQVDSVKQEVQAWLLGQGLSSDGICRLPITFYLIPAVAQQLPKDQIFSPLALGC